MSSRETGVSAGIAGHRHGSRTRTLIGTFGKTEIAVPRAGLSAADGETTERKSEVLQACQRLTLAADALIASTSPIRIGCVSRSTHCSAARLARTW
jgi:hypothetical protein